MLTVPVERCLRRPTSTWSSCPGPCCEQERHRQRKRYQLGVYRRPDSDAAWARVDTLLALGWTSAAIADTAGINAPALTSALGERRRAGTHQLSPHNTAALLALPAHPDPLTPTLGRVPAVGSARRLQALAAIGWSLAAVEAESGASRLTGQRLRAGQTRHVTPAVARQVAAAYQALAYRPGPSASARTMAARNGWAPPMAWDDELLDDPQAQPEGIAPHPERQAEQEAAPTSPLRTDRAEVEAAVLELTRLQYSAREIAERLGISSRGVTRVRTRATTRQENAA